MASISTWTPRISKPPQIAARCCCSGRDGRRRPQSKVDGDLARYAADIRGGKALPCGHYLSEEAPEENLKELRDFFAAGEL